MKMSTPDGTEVLQVEGIGRIGNSLALKVNVMGAMPMTVILTPGEARKGLRMIRPGIALFLMSFLFRK